MSAKCTNHPGRAAVFEYNGEHYCEKCQEGYEAAVDAVKAKNAHVEPKDCFVQYAGHDRWEPISGTGCAHWVSHQKDFGTNQGSNTCLKGYRYRVKDLVAYLGTRGTSVDELADVKVGDTWVDGREKHTGIVCQIRPAANPKDPDYPRMIVIRHDSSGQGRVAENDLHWLITSGGHGPSEGDFYRPR